MSLCLSLYSLSLCLSPLISVSLFFSFTLCVCAFLLLSVVLSFTPVFVFLLYSLFLSFSHSLYFSFSLSTYLSCSLSPNFSKFLSSYNIICPCFLLECVETCWVIGGSSVYTESMQLPGKVFSHENPRNSFVKSNGRIAVRWHW